MVGLVGVVGLWSAEGQALPWQLMGVAGSQGNWLWSFKVSQGWCHNHCCFWCHQSHRVGAEEALEHLDEEPGFGLRN